MTAKHKKALTAVGAVALAAVIALGGTLAWQSINQQALNEAAATLNPGGRLHDDFDGSNKDVYVENFTDAADGTPIFARVRLDEYMEIGTGAGTDRNLAPDAPLTASGLTVVGQGSVINDKTTWITRTPTGGLADEAGEVYWAWDTDGGQTVYMPTFNKNKDSLQADINGTYDGQEGTDVPYDDYVTYTEGQQVTADATYDDDNNDVEDEGTRLENETHAAKTTINGTVITMDEWLTRWEAYQTAVAGGTSAEQAAADTQVTGDFWVWDDDGWAYWANAIQPDTATGLLLDGIELVNLPSDSYYYGINVVGQFVTADDIGFLTGTGFYDRTAGRLPSTEAEDLLELITGTQIEIPPTEGQVDSSTSEEIRDAVVNGSQYEVVTIDDTEWYVLAIDYDTDRALILSRYVLEQRAFDADGSVYWKDSDLREYLNGDWLRGQETLYNAAVETILYDIDPDDGTSESDILTSTQDKVFLLSYRDLYGASADYDPRLSTYYEYMPLEGNQGDVLPDLLMGATTVDGTPAAWWTRSYVYTNGQVVPSYVRNVSNGGAVNYDRPTEIMGVRPALWIQLDTDKDLTPSDTLDYETSIAIRAAEISDMNLPAEQYNTVLIDGIEWYVLEVQDNRALLLSRYLHPQQMHFNEINKFVDEEQITRFGFNASNANSTYDTIWATSIIHDYLNGEWLSMHPTLNAAAAETTIETRFYLYNSNTEYWCDSVDKVFLLSTADMFGTTFDETVYIPNTEMSLGTTVTADDAREYTLGTVGVIVPEALRTADIFLPGNVIPTSPRDYVMRTSWHHTNQSGAISSGSRLTVVDMDGVLSAANDQWYFFFRPAMWVNINSSTSTITVTPPENAIDYSSNAELTVAVTTGTGDVTNPAVTWTIRGATSADTRFEGNTLYIGADEVSQRLQVVASYNDGGQIITDTVYVLVNPAPARLDAEASAYIRAADISKIGLGLQANEYSTVTIDGVEFYVLAVDEDNDLALLFSKDVVAEHVMRENGGDYSTGGWNAYSSSWTARAYLHEEWLPNHSTLSQVAQATEISFYTSSRYDGEALESSTDTVFLPSYADLTGFDAREEEDIAAEEPGEYTWGNSQLIPNSLRAASCVEGVDPTWWWLRTSVLDVNSTTGTRAVFKQVFCSNGSLYSTVSQNSAQGIRPMMWVRISAE